MRNQASIAAIAGGTLIALAQIWQHQGAAEISATLGITYGMAGTLFKRGTPDPGKTDGRKKK